MDAETACKILNKGGFEVAVTRRLPDGKGSQIRTVSGEIINVYDTGRCVVQGLYNEALLEMFGKSRRGASPSQLSLGY